MEMSRGRVATAGSISLPGKLCTGCVCVVFGTTCARNATITSVVRRSSAMFCRIPPVAGALRPAGAVRADTTCSYLPPSDFEAPYYAARSDSAERTLKKLRLRKTRGDSLLLYFREFRQRVVTKQAIIDLVSRSSRHTNCPRAAVTKASRLSKSDRGRSLQSAVSSPRGVLI